MIIFGHVIDCPVSFLIYRELQNLRFYLPSFRADNKQISKQNKKDLDLLIIVKYIFGLTFR